MALEILFSVLLILGSVYCLYYITVSAAATVYTDPLGMAFWPQLLLTLLILFLTINIIQIYRKTPKEKRNLDSLKINFKAIFTSYLGRGMILFVLYALLLPKTGFILTTFVMGICLSWLLGERRPVVLALFSLCATSLIFIIFFKGMSITLPRGDIPFLRNFALAVEKVLRSIGK